MRIILILGGLIIGLYLLNKKIPTAIIDRKGNLKGSKLKDKSIPSKNEKK